MVRTTPSSEMETSRLPPHFPAGTSMYGYGSLLQRGSLISSAVIGTPAVNGFCS
jgi:hypothetical protein